MRAKIKTLGVFLCAGVVGYAIGTFGARAQDGAGYRSGWDAEISASQATGPASRPRVIAGIDGGRAYAGARRAAMVDEPPYGDLGGGFIEMLMTGRDPSPRSGALYNIPRASYGPMGSGSEPMEPRRPLRRLASAPQPGMGPGPIERVIDPKFEKQTVDYRGPHGPGTIVVDTPNKFLYLVQPGGTALRYGIGVGRPGFSWAGMKTVSMKREWPDWRPPSEMIKRRPDLPRHMAGGPANPLGARALYLGSSLYRIHGTNEPNTIGTNVSSGCIRMTNDNVIDLYERVKVGAKVVVM